MAQDKIIRITADTTPIKNIRQEVQGLGRDLEHLNREPIGPRVPSPTDLSELVNQYGNPVQNPIPRPLAEESQTKEPEREPVERVEKPSIPRPLAEEPPEQEPEPTEESKKKTESPREKATVAERENASGDEQPLDRGSTGGLEQQLGILRQILKTAEEGNGLLVEGITHLEEIARRKYTEESTPKENENEEERIPLREDKPIPVGVPEDNSEQLGILRQILEEVNNGNELAVERTTYLEEIARRKYDEDTDNNNIIPPATPPVLPEGSEGEGEEGPERRRARREARRDEDEDSWAPRHGFTGIPGALVRGAIQAAGTAVNSRNTFEAGAGEIGAIGQTAGSLVAAGGSMFSGIPVVGGAIAGLGELAGTAISGISTIVSSYAQRAVAKAEELENNTRSYTQTIGVSSERAKQTALEEGAYAARDLGYNAGEYLSRVAQLRRSAGGKTLGATDEDPNGIREYQSQLAVQRSLGLDQGILNQLQGSMRFSREGEIGAEGSTSPSGVIRVFENAMKELKLPFSEIASTMGESLATFNKTTERILDKAGDFDAGKVATILANIRTATGMEGRQLERVQTAVTGGSISQDDVTQALLMRVGREVFPEADSMSALMEKIERFQEEPEYQKAFLKKLDDMTDNDEQLAQLMKAVYTNLSFGDIRSFIESTRGDKDFEKLFSTPVDPNVARGNERDAQYDRSEGRRTVGAIESATAEKTNRDAANGEAMLGVLSAIDSKVVQLATNSGLMEKTTSSINTALDALLKLALLVSEKDDPSWRDPKRQRDPNADWSLIPQGSLLMNLLKQMGLD